ncbi:Predicted arabinose efflux permease, MFS family [Alkalithermobacter thermoalcaliphilus JW-YL-7 = DSM 7308]|uniref:Major facilitator superfamily MFS_1 n=2 Tax=Clostridium paradoxum TaxID=29346 RepID=A0A150FQE7_CLOPD|nr:major facilitator superfamily MFS_1 [[Clostridium] paradoxum JW-YL-7 = DSM 7308]SHK80775.1 Predicted arabinose efflux permease, MFS family [[Clostridium] paradoxum JW-YL-7 = DSM 7308]
MYEKNIKNYLIGSSLIFFTLGCFSNFLSIHLKINNLDDAFIGSILSIQTLGTAIGSIISGIFLKKYTHKQSVLSSVVLISSSCILISISLNPTLLLISSFLLGVGMSFQFVTESPYLMKVTTTENRMNVFSLNFSIKNFSMMIGTLIAGFMSDINLSTKYTLLIFSIISSLSVFPILTIENIKMKNSDRTLKDIITILKIKPSINIILFNALIGIGSGLVVPFFSMYIKDTMNVDNKIVGVIICISQLGIVLGGLLTPYLSTLFGKARSVVICQALSIPFLLSISMFKNIFIISVCFLWRTALMNMAQPIIQNLSMETIEEKNMNMFSSFIILTSNIFRAAGTFLGGQIIYYVNYEIPYYITSVIYIIAIVVFTITFRCEDTKNPVCN